MYSINKTSFFSAVFLSLALSFSAQAEETGAKAAAVPAAKTEQAAAQAKPSSKDNKGSIQTITCPTGQCVSSGWVGGSCVEWCGGCPGMVNC